MFKISVNFELTGYLKSSGVEVDFSQRVEKAFDENSEEFENIVKEYENHSGNVRSDAMNNDDYDKSMMKWLTKQWENDIMDSIEKISEVFKQVFLGKKECAYVEYGGYILNPKDFCAVKIGQPKFHCTKTN